MPFHDITEQEKVQIPGDSVNADQTFPAKTTKSTEEKFIIVLFPAIGSVS